jgi:hypothetical protein
MPRRKAKGRGPNSVGNCVLIAQMSTRVLMDARRGGEWADAQPAANIPVLVSLP